MRIRSPSNFLGERKNSKSVNQLDGIKRPLILPNIKKKRYLFYDDIKVSPQYIKISSTQRHEITSKSKIVKQHKSKKLNIEEILNSGIFDQDRILQKQQEYDQKYIQLQKIVQLKAAQRRKRKSCNGLSLVYDRYIKLF